MKIITAHQSANFSKRKGKIKFIIIHSIALGFEESLNMLTKPVNKVSAHYLIKFTGEIYQLVSDDLAAWHAGRSSWYKHNLMNDESIGIELDNFLDRPYSTEQLNACIELCQKLMHKYKIPKQNVICHSDIAPDRKIDPGIFFDWAYLANHGIGLWHDIDTTNTFPKILYNFKDKSPNILTLQDNLKKLGYKIDLTGVFDKQTNFVIRAFQAKYNSNVIKTAGIDFYRNLNSIYSWDDVSQKILLNLLTKVKQS